MTRGTIALNTVTLAILHLRLCEVESAQKVLKSLILLDLYCVFVLKPHYLIEDGHLTALGQLLCKDETDLLMSVMVYFLDNDIVSVREALILFGVSDELNLRDKKYARYYLEAVVCNSEKKSSIPKAMVSIINGRSCVWMCTIGSSCSELRAGTLAPIFNPR
eukprot:m.61159 g.61159  ORF g.61159 m.61159 type:complete len:162 (+) comp34974_c0_seq3:126-611(+)